MNTTKLINLTKYVGVGMLLADPVMAQSWGGDLASRERSRRENAVREAEQHLSDGRTAYAKGDFQTAVDEYRAALDKTPRGTLAATRRASMTAHLSDGSVALAQKHRGVGKYDEARSLLESVLLVDPGNTLALRELEYLDDPIRTNPALTYDHSLNVDKVRRLLYMGEGFYNLGQFDKAEAEFNKVLRIDKYNKAARRWLERCASIRSDYYRSAYDHTRAELLSQVDQAWEIAINPELSSFEQTSQIGSNTVEEGASIANKLRSIIIPQVDMVDLSIEEAIDELRLRSRELDPTTIDPNKKGINFVIRDSRKSSASSAGDLGLEVTDPTASVATNTNSLRVSELKLTNVPLINVLSSICDLTGLRYRIDEYSVTLLPNDAAPDDDILTRTWNVTPTFTSDLGGDSGASGGGVVDDPFAPSSGSDSGGSAFKQPSVQDLLASAGVLFENGASASLLPGSSTLIVRNSINNLDLVDDIVNSINKKTPKQIKILTKFVEVSQDNVDELGFDWALGQAGSNIDLRGGSTGNGQAVNDFNTSTGRVITSGLRSGDTAIAQDSISDLISSSTGAFSSTATAPGILSLGGIVDGTTLEVIFRGLSQKRGVDIMTAPSVVARSGEEATIEIIREFIYPSEYDPPELPNEVNATGTFPVTPATPTAFETRNTGVTLKILPQTGDANDYVINLNFQPEVVEFEGFINYGSPITGSATNANGDVFEVVITENRIEMPVFATRRVETAITIFDGHTVSVGGLMSEEVQTVEDKIPILGDIPLIGRLFQSNSESRVKSNLVIFVTAQVIDATGRPVRSNESVSADSELESLFTGADSLLPDVIQ